MFANMTTAMKKYTDIPVASLVIYANPHGRGTWIDESTDPEVIKADKTHSEALAALMERQVKAFESAVRSARMVKLAGAHHYVFLSNEVDVLREMKAFLSSLR